MKAKHIIGFHTALVVCIGILFSINFFYLNNLEIKVEELKPKETKTIEDYHNLIEESKKKIDEITEDKWLKVSDIIKALKSHYWEPSFLRSEKWSELLNKAEDAPQVLWRKPIYDSATLVDVEIGITAEQIIKALQSIDPNEFIRQKEETKTTETKFQSSSALRVEF